MMTTAALGTSLLELVGHTPLVRLHVAKVVHDVEIYAKAELANPSGSVKDRPAARIIFEAEQSGDLRLGKVIVDATSGNTGRACAMIGAARGYHVLLCLPKNANVERRQMLRAYNANLVFTDPMEGADGGVNRRHPECDFRVCLETYADTPDSIFYNRLDSSGFVWQSRTRRGTRLLKIPSLHPSSSHI